jgi:hypothetical protein
LLFGVSRFPKGVDPSFKGALGKGDDYTRFFTLNNAEILGFEPAHDPNHEHKGDSGAWGSDPLKDLGGPEVIGKFDGFNLAELGFWGWPEGCRLLEGGQLEPELLTFYYQNRHRKKGTTDAFYGSLGS